MAKTRHMRKRGRGSRKRGHKGGDLAGNPASAWGWGLGTAGNGWTQFMDTLTLQPGQNIAAAKSNVLVPVGRPNANEPLQSVKMNGGRRRKHSRRSRSRKGGNWGVVLNQAAAPLALLGANQYFGKRSKRSRKH
uniref:Uncharacterized protein n=1 Tax=viral metagenome TaxID=1070528 RepID=A0A6C0IW34_9ZZZZ